MTREVIDIFTKRPLNEPEALAALIRELHDIDAEIEPKQRRAEMIRRQLGLLGVEKGIDQERDA